MLIEEVTRSEEEEALRNGPGSLKGDLLSEYEHPAVDIKAKWNLKPYLVLLLIFLIT